MSVACALFASQAWGQADPALVEPFDLVAAMAEGTPLTADQAAARAQEVSPSIERAEALTRAAEAGVERARALLWPRLDTTVRAAHIDGFKDAIIGGMDPGAVQAGLDLAGQITDPASQALWTTFLQGQAQGTPFKIPRNQVGLAARLSWPVIDTFLAVYPTIDAARANVRVSQADRAARQARVRLSAREAFFQLARARGSLAVAQRALLQTQAQQERIDAGVRAGIRPPSESASAASRVAAAQQTLTAAETAVDVADAALRSMLQQGDGPVYAISEPLLTESADPEPLPQLLERARAHRPEVVALEAVVDVRQHQIKADKAAGYPRLGVYLGGDYAMPNKYQLPPRQEFQPSWEVGATLTYAPNDTVSARRKASETEAQIEGVEAELKELLRSLELEVRRSRVTLAHAQRNIEAAQAAVVAAQAAYDRRMAELGAGEVVMADVIAADQELNGARLRVLDAGIDQQLARVRLAYALGE
ncbi:MAG TPA: TolC family protein [Polyangiales bacterium]